jgi:TolB protein
MNTVCMYLLSISCLLTVFYSCGLEVQASTRVKIPLVCIADGADPAMNTVTGRLQSALAFSGQFTIAVESTPSRLTKKTIKSFYTKGYPLALVMTHIEQNKIEWRLYDTMKAHMIIGKKCEKGASDLNWWALHIANSVWPELTGQDGFFMTKIAYSKQVAGKKGRSYRHIYVADFDGMHEQAVVNTPTINIMPRWNYDHNNPLLFYSEYTNDNVRMMMIDTHKRRKIASNFEGINMLTSFSADGKKVVYCASRGDGNCQMYYHENGVFKRLLYTDVSTGKSLTDGNNISPTMSHDGSIVYFCSDFHTHLPQLYAYDINSGAVTKITDGGYCASPAYCHKTQHLAYTKKVDGIMQLYVFNTKTGIHQQLTHDEYTKDECSWSPCGNYLVLSIEKNNRSRVAVYSMLTKQLQGITLESATCGYPAWSPIYSNYTLADSVGVATGSVLQG